MASPKGKNGNAQDNGQCSKPPTKHLSAAVAAQTAMSYLEQLTGHSCEFISAINRTETGWAVTVELVELERVPRTTDLMASYVVRIDDQGELEGYERLQRYSRGQVLSEQGE